MIPEIETLPLIHLASGDRLSLQVYKFLGVNRAAKPGRKVYIQSNLHGSEITGNAVIHRLIDWLTTLEPTQLTGQIWLVPACNPIGTNHRAHHFNPGRFNPYDGENWNRIFWEYQPTAEALLAFAKTHLEADRSTIEQAFRQQMQASFAEQRQALRSARFAPFCEHYRTQLQSLCLDAQYVIDLHTSGDQGLTYLYYFRDRQASAKLFMLPIGILLNEYAGGAFDEAFLKPWLALEDCFTQLGRKLQFDLEAWTLELGSAMQIDPQAVDRGFQAVKNYLLQKGILRVPATPTAMPSIAAMKLVCVTDLHKYYAPVGGMVQNRVPLGKMVEAGQLLYQLLTFNKEGQLPAVTEVCAERSGIVYDLSINAAVNQGEYVLGIL
ncbi:succinylglutamate desuccinylase/aspartoacylase family protein [Phormidium tenue FACHB-886]|nr:succinylglutamate desuccinylase/aspartoacylase family protein [Phormidium tenue FACHB-886]